jgi:hypothetical protein
MDLSKLPKLSDTKSQTPAEDTPQPVADQIPAPPGYQPMAYRPQGIGGEIWISLIIGILLAYMGRDFARFVSTRFTHETFHTNFTWPDDDPNGRAGQEVAYFDLQNCQAWSDMGIFLFGLILLFEAAAKTFIVIKPGNVSRAVLMLAILLTLLGVVLNVIACLKMFSVQITPLLSGLAVAFGGWILFDEWITLQRMTPVPKRA